MKNCNETPLVTIGLAVYNGERYLAEAIESLLHQTYKNFELIISDNASTDKTADICREYEKVDSRIIYRQQQKNIGGTKNFNYLVSIANGEYFMWAASDDLWDTDYIEKCLCKLRTHPEAVMCQTDIRYMDINGEIIKETHDFTDSSTMTELERIDSGLSFNAWIIYGLYRMCELKKTRLLKEVYGSDIIFGLEIHLLGQIVKAEGPLFSYRVIPKTDEDYFRIFSNDQNVQNRMRKGPATELIRELYRVLACSKLQMEQKEYFLKKLVSSIVIDKNFYLKIVHEHQHQFINEIVLQEDLISYITFLVTAEEASEGITQYKNSHKKKYLEQITIGRPLLIWAEGLERYQFYQFMKSNKLSFFGFIGEDIEGENLYGKPVIPFDQLMNWKDGKKPFLFVSASLRSVSMNKLEELKYERKLDFLERDFSVPFFLLE